MNPFDLAITQQTSEEGSVSNGNITAGGDTSTSTVTGSNEPTPFDASSSTNVFGFSQQKRGENMSASNSAGSNSSFTDVSAQTPNTSAHSTPANTAHQEPQQVLVTRDHTKLNANVGNAGEEVDEKYKSGDDLVRGIVEAVREQRMSLIQTGRQFVFVYSAVLAGLLRDLRNEGVM